MCIGPSDSYERIALPALRKIDPTAPILTRRNQVSIHSAYNSLITEALSIGARGLVLTHDDVAIRRPDAAHVLATLLAQADVGVVGAVGARNVYSLEWWWYDQHGFVEERDFVVDSGRSTADVDVVDGVVLGLSGRALETLRFDEIHYPPFHGYDLEISSLAQARGLRVLVTDLDVYHDSYPHGKITDPEAHSLADRTWRRRWRSGLENDFRYRRAVMASTWQTKPRRLLRAVRR